MSLQGSAGKPIETGQTGSSTGHAPVNFKIEPVHASSASSKVTGPAFGADRSGLTGHAHTCHSHIEIDAFSAEVIDLVPFLTVLIVHHHAAHVVGS